MKARVIVTLKCNRNCENCCNKEEVFEQHKILTNPDDLLTYDTIMITGGEPMLIPEKVIEFLNWLIDKEYKGRIYLYTALYNNKLSRFYSKILSIIDGFQFTVHNEATVKEIIELKQLSESYLLEGQRDKSFRLNIDERLYSRYDFSNINFRNWTVVRKMKWLVNCPLPEGEELFVYEL